MNQLPARLTDRTLLTPAGCMEWQGAISPNGYGCISWERKTASTHRLAYKLAKGPIPPGMLVRHTCDNKKCINPEHLILGSNQENQTDKVLRGRSLKGEQQPSSKLTVQAVREIRELCNQITPIEAITARYGISRTQAVKIVQRKCWTHVD